MSSDSAEGLTARYEALVVSHGHGHSNEQIRMKQLSRARRSVRALVPSAARPRPTAERVSGPAVAVEVSAVNRQRDNPAGG